MELLSGRPGVLYDELGLNGAELLDLERWNPDLRRALLARARPNLIVLAYGSNDEGMAPSARTAYQSRAHDLLLALKQASGAPVLLIGPLDRIGRKPRQRAVLRAGADWIIRSMQELSLATGCAFWDARQAMGGPGAIARWRRAGQAQADLVHLNGLGYQRLGNLLSDTLVEALDLPPARPPSPGRKVPPRKTKPKP